jgi:hypothetical protein
MKTNLWGPSAWKFLHAVSFSYPDNPSKEKRESARELFRSLRFMLPCEECCSHYCAEFDKDPVDAHLESRKQLTMWLVNFHNKVNERLGKSKVSYEEAVALYDHETCEIETCGEEKETEPKFSYIPVILCLLVVLIILQKNKWTILKLFTR